MVEPSTKISNFVLVRERWVVRELEHLREDQATGPDGLPAVILRKCARQLSRFVTMLIRMMLLLARWPDMWKIHRVCPLYKKAIVYKPANYKGLHITPVISKVAERVLKIPSVVIWKLWTVLAHLSGRSEKRGDARTWCYYWSVAGYGLFSRSKKLECF